MKDVNIIDMIKKHEGLRLEAYQCTAKVWTIGYGHTKGVAEGLTCIKLQADQWFTQDLTEVYEDLDKFLPWYRNLNLTRRAVMLDMGFNLGVDPAKKGKLLQFKQTLFYIENGHYEKAAQQMMKSKWAEQVGKRAITLSNMMREG